MRATKWIITKANDIIVAVFIKISLGDTTMLITLSPSKGQDFESKSPTQFHSQARQLNQSQMLIDELKKHDQGAIMDLMNISDNLAELNVGRVESYKTPFTVDNAKQAIFAFKGDVYSTIDADDYSKEELEFAQAHVRILSGLYGALRPLDLIQAYRLEMKTKLLNSRGRHLYDFWGDTITEQLNQDFIGQSEKILINLASNEYYKSLKPKLLVGRVLSINFKEVRNGETRVVAIFTKRARGLMANWLIRNKIEQSDRIKAFDVDGYQFDASLSNDEQWTFTRPQPSPKG